MHRAAARAIRSTSPPSPSPSPYVVGRFGSTRSMILPPCMTELAHITRLPLPLAPPALTGFLPEMRSRSTTPNAYT